MFTQTFCALHVTASVLLAVVAARADEPAPPAELAPCFQPPAEFRGDLGSYRSPLVFADGTKVTEAKQWSRRRAEILDTWHKLMGPWPALIEKPRVETVGTTRRDKITQEQVKLSIALGGHAVDGLLLKPDGPGPFPTVLVVYYEAMTGVGLGGELRDYGWQLANRGFVVLSIGMPSSRVDFNEYSKARGSQYLGPQGEKITIQPLSALAYAAANAHTVLAQRPDVRADRIGVVGHSFGGKWAMFAACLYEKFAAAAWSDPGIVFDERDPNVNYWDVWYLGAEADQLAAKPGPFRGPPSEQKPRTGAYKALVEGGHDLVELQALMAPRPFLVSGGSCDPPARWRALNHAIAVNKLVGYENRVAMTNRPTHGPTAEANEQLYRFFVWWLRERK